MQGEVSMVVLLGSAFGVDLEKELFDLKGSLLPSGKMQGEVSIIVRQGSGLGECIQEGLCSKNKSDIKDIFNEERTDD
jgi:hypothetical protein